MKFCVAVGVIERGYVEVIADSPGEAKALAEQMALDGEVLFYDIEPQEAKIEAVIPLEHESNEDDGEVNLIKEILSSEKNNEQNRRLEFKGDSKCDS